MKKTQEKQYIVAIGRISSDGTHQQEIGSWLVEITCASSPVHNKKIKDVLHIPVSGICPTSVARNGLVKLCQQKKVDILFMVDDDAIPPEGFFSTAFDFLTTQKVPSIIACPYCCGGTNQEVQVFEWQSPNNDYQKSFTLAHIPREDAARRTGIQKVCNIGTHCIAYDMRVFDNITTPYYEYSYNQDHSKVLETEDTNAHRKMYFKGIPIYVSWDHWAIHMKMTKIGKPWIVQAEDINERYYKEASAVLSGQKTDEIFKWLGDTGDHYLGFGGMGDALLLLATCYNNPQAKVVFFSNNVPFVSKLFNLFDVHKVIRPNNYGLEGTRGFIKQMTQHPNFCESAHLPDNFNYTDWALDPKKYAKRLTMITDWKERIGSVTYDKPTVVIAPAGSTKDEGRQRYLEKAEYDRVVANYVNQGWQVITVGNSADMKKYKGTGFWLNTDYYIQDGIKKAITFREMLQFINGATLVVGVDTWLKTYSLLCGIPTTVFKTRWNGKYRMIGSDESDAIFLNPEIWKDLTICEVEDYI